MAFWRAPGRLTPGVNVEAKIAGDGRGSLASAGHPLGVACARRQEHTIYLFVAGQRSPTENVLAALRRGSEQA
jgi:hypothetical protein